MCVVWKICELCAKKSGKSALRTSREEDEEEKWVSCERSLIIRFVGSALFTVKEMILNYMKTTSLSKVFLCHWSLFCVQFFLWYWLSPSSSSNRVSISLLLPFDAIPSSFNAQVLTFFLNFEKQWGRNFYATWNTHQKAKKYSHRVKAFLTSFRKKPMDFSKRCAWLALAKAK